MASYEQAKSLLIKSVSRPTLYSLSIDKLSTDLNKHLQLFVNRVNLPGLLYEGVTTMGQENMGIIQSSTAGMMFSGGNRFTFEVIEGSDFQAYEGLRNLFNSATAMGGNPSGNNRTQRMAFYEDYIFTTTLTKLEFPDGQSGKTPSDVNSDVDAGYKVVAKYTFDRCHMTEISQIDLQSSAYDTFLTFNCTIAYESYHYDSSKKVEVYGR